MDGKRLLLTLWLDNLLSYGPEGTAIELQPLNVLIGPNGSGKSNLIEAISLLKAAPTDIFAPIRAGGGMPEWVWKGVRGVLVVDFNVATTISYLERLAPQTRLKIVTLRLGKSSSTTGRPAHTMPDLSMTELLSLPARRSNLM